MTKLYNNNYIVELRNIYKAYDGKNVVKNVNLKIKKGEFVTLLGPSGCGKTTTLRMIAGFEQPTSGEILFDGQNIANLPPYKRRVNTVFQKYALFPHLNVFKNVAFGLKLKRIKDQNNKEILLKNSIVEQTIYDSHYNAIGTKPVKFKDQYEYIPCQTPAKKPLIPFLSKYKYTSDGKVFMKVNKWKSFVNEKVMRALKIVGLTGYEDRNVNSLSGGQQQRVAIARAIINEPEILLLDEPLGALDLKMRQEMQLELKEMHKKLGITFIYVTHDQEEALTMSDTIVVMRDGAIYQEGSPMNIYNEPANAYVADFIGESNILDGIMPKDKLVTFCGYTLECVDAGFETNQPVDVVIRPEDIEIKKPGAGNFDGVIKSSMFRGVHYEMSCICNDYEFLIHSTKEFKAGTKVSLSIDPDCIHIMNKEILCNTVEATIDSEDSLSFLGASFKYNKDVLFNNGFEQSYIGKKAKISFEFVQADMYDSEYEAPLAGNVESMIYKGKNYIVCVRTDDNHHILCDTEYLWDDGDRVGINVEPNDFKFISFIED